MRSMGFIFCCLSTPLFAQIMAQAPPPAPPAPTPAASTPQDNAPLVVTLQDAIARAKNISPEYHAALTDKGIAREDKVQAVGALLPNVNYDAQYIYTKPHTGDVPRFIANNATHEYISMGNAHQSLSGIDFANYRRAVALQDVAKARAEIAARGLVVVVVQAYYGFVVSQRKYSTAQQAADEAARFLDVSKKLENGGEVAHSDVIKAQLQYNDKQRDFRESRLMMEKTRVDLALLIFPDFNQNFSVVDDLRLPDALPPMEEVEKLAKQNNPDLSAAMAAFRAERMGVFAARAAYLPVVALDYNYGIDATHFALKTDGVSNLGYSTSAALTIPIWNWGSTRSKVKQSILRRDQAKLELTFTQRKLLGQLKTLYNEVDAASAELDLLRQSAQLAADSLRLTTLRYQGGEATVLEVVDAQNTLATARNAYDDGEVRYRAALAGLQTLTGTL
jgi:outer membrane protein TolC